MSEYHSLGPGPEHEDTVIAAMVEVTPKTTAALRKELAEAEARESREQQLLRDSTPILRSFTLLPVAPDRWQPLYDEDAALYRLDGRVTNKAQAEAAGHYGWTMNEGGMTYVFNRLSGRLITGVGGGTHWLPEARGQEVFDLLSEYLREHPEGGDVTDIVLSGFGA